MIFDFLDKDLNMLLIHVCVRCEVVKPESRGLFLLFTNAILLWRLPSYWRDTLETSTPWRHKTSPMVKYNWYRPVLPSCSQWGHPHRTQHSCKSYAFVNHLLYKGYSSRTFFHIEDWTKHLVSSMRKTRAVSRNCTCYLFFVVAIAAIQNRNETNFAEIVFNEGSHKCLVFQILFNIAQW